MIVATLAGCAGSTSASAARLGISRGTLHQELRRYRPLTPQRPQPAAGSRLRSRSTDAPEEF